MQANIVIKDGYSLIEQSKWTQITGPKATIISPEQLNTQVLLPSITHPAQLKFRFSAINSDGYIAWEVSTVYIRATPAPSSPTIPQPPSDIEQEKPLNTTAFEEQVNVGLETIITSNAIEVEGVANNTPISIDGGEYSLDDGDTYTTVARTASNGDKVLIRITTAQTVDTTTLATLNIGKTSYLFSVTTGSEIVTPEPTNPADESDIEEDFEGFRPFIMTWEAGEIANKLIFYAQEDKTYNYHIDWGDGTTDTTVEKLISHTYTAAATYTITIRGQFPWLRFSCRSATIEQWGDIQWQSMNSSFSDCHHSLTFNAIDAPDLSRVKGMSYMFYGG